VTTVQSCLNWDLFVHLTRYSLVAFAVELCVCYILVYPSQVITGAVDPRVGVGGNVQLVLQSCSEPASPLHAKLYQYAVRHMRAIDVGVANDDPVGMSAFLLHAV